MQAPLKLFCLAFACASLSAAPALAQPATEKRAPAKVGAPKPAPKAAEAKATEPKLKASATTAAQPDAEPAPAPAAKPSPAPRPPAEEVQHTARFDAAIAATRNHPVSAEDAARIRDAVKAIAEADLAKGKALRRPDQGARGTQADRLVPVSGRLRHCSRNTRLHAGQSGLARPRAPQPARRGGIVQQQRQPPRDQGVLRRDPARHWCRHGRAGVRAGRRKG